MSEEFSLKEVNRVRNPKNLTGMEKKHLPVFLEVPDTVEKGKPFRVRVKVGGIDGVEHPNLLGHWINWVELYAGEVPMARIAFAPVFSDGYEVSFTITLEDSSLLRLREYCNLHGVWEGDEETGGAKRIFVK
ncbi:MAG: class II SORL domain-containing protein [Candidatus Bathyarchaeia archaeon]